ncbi:MAG: lysophospholipase [Rhodothermaceae bacterium]|nr:lysophospholipase [Rhodothermaceae bacterium]
MITKYLSDSMIKSGNSPVFNTPADFGLNAENVQFRASDGVTLSGWLIKGGTDKVIIQSHFGVQSSKAGYTPKGKGMMKMWNTDISYLKHAQYLVQQGYSILMYDFRNHGESGEGICPWVTWGPEEHKDVIAAVDYITNHPVYLGCKIGLLSICMGAASTTYAYGVEDGLKKYTNIKAMIAIQPLLYPDFVAALGLPGFLGRRVSKLNSKRAGMDLVTTSFMPNVKDIPIPTLVVQNKNDPYLNPDSINQYYDELRVEKDLLWLDLEKKRAAGYHYLTEQPADILNFFNKYL